MMSAVVSLVWIFVAEQAAAQSVIGTSTTPIIKVGQGSGAGTPQGNLTAAVHVVGDMPVGVVRVRIPGFGAATVDVECVALDGNRIVVGGPIRAGSTILPDFTFVYLIAEDNGAPVRGEPVDRVITVAAPFDVCEFTDILFSVLDLFALPISHGDYTIRDGM
jgi:hypothetical protein